MQPVIPSGGPALTFDFPGLRIGCSEYDEGPTGCTVFDFGRGAFMAADVRGGSPGTLFADMNWVNAICFAGGSLMGLEAAMGVAGTIFANRPKEKVEWLDLPIVAGAIVFDYDRDTGVYPDRALGAAAYDAAQPGRFPLGRRGAGRNVTVGKSVPSLLREPGGQGGAVARLGEVAVLAFVVLNSVGAIVDRSGAVIHGHMDEAVGVRRHLREALPADEPAAPARGNTTLSLIVTNQRMNTRDLTQLGRQVHASMARAIQPFHTPYDGDVLFAVTTGAVRDEKLAESGHLGHLASETMWDAILAAFPDHLRD